MVGMERVVEPGGGLSVKINGWCGGVAVWTRGVKLGVS